MWLVTVILGVIFLCYSVSGEGVAIPDVTTIYEVGKNKSDEGCVKARVHARTNALGLGFVNEENLCLDSYSTDIPNITCDSNFGNDNDCTTYDFENEINLESLNSLKGIPMINGRAYKLLDRIIKINYLKLNSFLYFTKTPQRIEHETDFIVIRIKDSSNMNHADLFYNCNYRNQSHGCQYGPFILEDRGGSSVRVCCSRHYTYFTISMQEILSFDFTTHTIKIISHQDGTDRIIINWYYYNGYDLGNLVMQYVSVATDDSDKNSFSLAPKAIKIDAAGMTSHMFTPTSKNLCLSVVFHSKYHPLYPSKLKISTVGLLNEESTVLDVDTVKSGTNIKLVNVSLKNLNPIKINIANAGIANITLLRVSSCNPEGEEVAELPLTSPICPEDQTARLGSLTKTSSPIFTTSLDKIDPLTVKVNGRCRNGGVLTSAGCACTPGFSGPSCEVGCGRNRFGLDCEGWCSSYAEECAGLLLCTKYTGCHCAPGYSGQECTQACAPGWYGNDCSHRCGHCAGNSACDIYTGHCTACEEGYLAPHCQKESVYYGSKPELRSPSYGIIVVTFDPNNYVTHGEPPQMYQIQIREKGSEWRVYTTKSIQMSNDGPGKQTEVSENIGGLENSFLTTSSEESRKEIQVSEQIEGLKNGFLYEVRVLFIDAYFFKYDGDLVQVAEILTKCDIPETYDYKLTSEANTTSIQFSWNYVIEDTKWCPLQIFEMTWRERWKARNQFTLDNSFTLDNLVPGSPISFKVRAQTSGGFAPYSKTLAVSTVLTELSEVRNLRVKASGSSSVQVSWDPPRGARDAKLRYTVSYKCVNRPACSPGCQNVSEAQLTQEATSITLSPLLPFTMYLVTVSADGGAQSSVYAGTSKVVPTEVPLFIAEKTVRTNTSLTVFWDQGPVCTGFLQGYNYQITQASEMFKILASGFTRETHASFHNLSASTDYEIRVYVVTVAGWNPSAYLAININTSATVPEAVTNLTVYKRGRSMLGLRWAAPRATYGPLKSFTVSHSLGQTVVSHTIEPTHCVVWPELYCHTFEGLRSNKKYNVSVSARNAEVSEDGALSFTSAVTKESSPSAPVKLKVTNSSSTSLELEWNHPEMANGIVRSFLISVEETEKYEQENCCQIYPFIEIPVKEELPTYSAEVSGLHPASTYFVSVSGKTVGLGPSQSLVATTKPPSLPLTMLPRVLDIPELSWLPQENLPEVNNSDIYTSLIQAHILLAVPNEIQPELETKSCITDPKLESLLKQTIGKPFFFIAEYNQDEDLDLNGPLDNSDSTWGQPPAALPRGVTYQLVAAHVLDYSGVLNVDLRFSTPFLHSYVKKQI